MLSLKKIQQLKYCTLAWKSVVLLFFVYMSVASAENNQESLCWQHPIFSVAVTNTKAINLWQAFLQSKAYDPVSVSKTLVNPQDTKYIMSMYQADVNNDHVLEDVFVFGPYGSGGYTNVQVLQEVEGKFNYLGGVPQPENSEGDGPWYVAPYQDPGARKDEFLTNLCGKTYMVFDNNHFRDAYLWQGNASYPACDNDWLRYERLRSLNLEQQQIYNQAFTNLNFIVNKCVARKDTAVYLELQNSLAWMAYKNGDFSTCLKVINLMQAQPSFTNRSAKFKNAVNLTRERCSEAKAEPLQLDQAAGPQAYIWLLAPKALAQPVSASNDANWSQLFAKTAPNKTGDILMSGYGANAPLLSTLIYNSTIGGMLLDAHITNHRYVWLQGCIPHDCGVQGFVWVDTLLGTSLMGFIQQAYVQKGEETTVDLNLSLTSRNFNVDTVPLVAKQEMSQSIKRELANQQELAPTSKPELRELSFFDMAQNKKIKLQPSWLNQDE